MPQSSHRSGFESCYGHYDDVGQAQFCMHVVIVRVTMQLICVFVFTYSESRFSHDAAGFHVFAIYNIVASPQGWISGRGSN